MKPTDSPIPRQVLRSAIWVAVAVLSAGPLAAAHEPGYGFYRTVEGEVRLTTLDRAEPLEVEPNYPLLLGDRVWVSPAARLEALLPDQTILRAGGGTDLYFQDLALYAGETAGEGTVLRLLEGEIQLVVAGYRDEREPVRVDTPNATIYLQEAGVYRIYADQRQWSEVVVREGFGEVALADGSIVVRANEEAVIDGEVNPRVRVYPAGALDALEAWGNELDREAELAAAEPYVDESLRYQSAPLRRHGQWVSVDAGYAWRPYVSVSWRPYTHGYWTYTPVGHYWVSAEPWAFTFHYGSWSMHPYHGWVWYPGTVFSPAWVTWYWGPTYVGWVPAGYYSHYYRHAPGLSFGFYGWAGGSWSYYSHWTFCPTGYFGWRSYGSHWRSGAEIGRTAHYEVPRGVILGSTRGIPRGFAGKPDEVVGIVQRMSTLERGPSRKLPDVTDFVARRPTLSAEVREAVFAENELAAREALRRGSAQSLVSGMRGETPRAGLPERPSPTGTAGRLSQPIRTMPGRADVTREELVRSEPLRREPLTGAVRPIQSAAPGRPASGTDSDRSDRSAPARTEPIRGTPRPLEAAPGRSVDLPPTARPVPRPDSGPVSSRIEPRRPVGQPDDFRAPERQPAAPRPVFGQPLSPSPRALPPSPSAGDSGSGSEGRVPVVRRVLDGIRGIHSPSAPSPPASAPSSPAPSSATPSSPAPPAPPSSRLSPPSSAPSSGVSRLSPPSSGSSPPASIQRPTAAPPQASRPSSGPSVRSFGSSISSRGSSSSSSSSKTGSSSASARSQSRPKSKPPGD